MTIQIIVTLQILKVENQLFHPNNIIIPNICISRFNITVENLDAFVSFYMQIAIV